MVIKKLMTNVLTVPGHALKGYAQDSAEARKAAQIKRSSVLASIKKEQDLSIEYAGLEAYKIALEEQIQEVDKKLVEIAESRTGVVASMVVASMVLAVK